MDSERKFHRSCGGVVVYRESHNPDFHFSYAGFCLKCEGYPIVQKNIIFQLENGKFERLNKEKKEWEILIFEELPENLDLYRNKIVGQIRMIHELKTLKKYFKPLSSGLKLFEIRKNDREFKIDDILILKEWNKKNGFSGRELSFKITYILSGGKFGIDKNYCIMSLKKV